MELLFNGVTLRSFSFSFDLAPRDERESDTIKRMLRIFKQNMQAKRSSDGGNSSGLFLRSPNVFQLNYKTGRRNHNFLHKFKPMALLNMAINYTGAGTYATYDDTTPVHMKLDLSFQELNPVYSEDYDSEEGKGRSWILMSYFRELPNFQYQSPFIDSLSSSEYVTVKNIFRRVKLRDDLQNIFTVFDKFVIKEGARPDTVAEEVYGKSDLDWVVLYLQVLLM